MSRIRHITLTLILLLLASTALHASRPLAGVTGVTADSPRGMGMARLLETHLGNILGSTGVFDQVNVPLLKDQLNKFNCLEDSCVLRFAREAKIGLIIRGSLKDNGDSHILDLYALGTAPPHNGRVVYRMRVRLPASGAGLSAREFSYIYEEQAAQFLSVLLGRYRFPLQIKKEGDGVTVPYDRQISGTFEVCRFEEGYEETDEVRPFRRVGRITLKGGVLAGPSGGWSYRKGDFILYGRRDQGEYLKNYYYGRKKEIVFEKPTVDDTLYMMLFTVPGSATMPVVAPLVGYYGSGDYQGLGLWAVNAAPYLYLEYDGLKNRPKKYEENGRDIPRERTARYHFGLYMLLAGGMSLFVDAFSHDYLGKAAYYQGSQPLMGNSLSAAYLSLICGGGGHFYRGYRLWGYLYFHTDNLLVYATLREFSRSRTYNPSTGSYDKGDINKRRAYGLLGALCAVKAVEITHVLLLKDRIRSGRVLEERYALEGIFRDEEDGGMILGASVAYRF